MKGKIKYLGVVVIFFIIVTYFLSDAYFLSTLKDKALKEEIIYQQKQLDLSSPNDVYEITIYKEVEDFSDLKKLKKLKIININHTSDTKLKAINEALPNVRLKEVQIAFGTFNINKDLTNLMNAEKVNIRLADSIDLSVFKSNPPKIVSIYTEATILNPHVVDDLCNITEFSIFS